jgi:hypothetical protein
VSAVPFPAVIEDLAAWRRRFDAGEIKFHGLFQPKLAPGERVACRIATVHVIDGGTGDISELGGAVVPKVDGAARATSDRLLVTANRGRIRQEWRWADVAAVQLLPAGLGVRVEQRAGGADVVGSVWNRTVPTARPDALKLLVEWLQVEAAYVASVGPDATERWFTELPQRLERTLSGG